MRSAIATIAALLLATFALVSGNGLQNTILALRASTEGFPFWLIGALMSAYFVGFVAGCRIVPRIVARVGHIRAFSAAAALASIAALAHALVVSEAVWLALRVLTGFCLAGMQTITESWINERSPTERRGRMLAVYRMVDLTAVTASQVLLTMADPAGFTLFVLASILVSFSLVPVALTRTPEPPAPRLVAIDVRKILRLSPLAFACVSAVGIANGSFWAVAAVYVQSLGYDLKTIASFMSLVVIAGAAAQWPLGLASDIADRRLIITIVAAAASAAALLLALFGASGSLPLLSLGAVFGFFAMPMFGLGAAHANDFAEPGEFLAVSGGLFLLYGIGAIVGPLVTSAIMGLAGVHALFVVVAVMYGSLASLGLVRYLLRSPVGRRLRRPFVPIPRSTPTVFRMDPRAPADAEPAAADVPAEDDAGAQDDPLADR